MRSNSPRLRCSSLFEVVCSRTLVQYEDSAVLQLGFRVAAPFLKCHGEHVGAFEVSNACLAVAALPKWATIDGAGP